MSTSYTQRLMSSIYSLSFSYLSPNNNKVWFQNRRTKWRKRHAAELATAKKKNQNNKNNMDMSMGDEEEEEFTSDEEMDEKMLKQSSNSNNKGQGQQQQQQHQYVPHQTLGIPSS